MSFTKNRRNALVSSSVEEMNATTRQNADNAFQTEKIVRERKGGY